MFVRACRYAVQAFLERLVAAMRSKEDGSSLYERGRGSAGAAPKRAAKRGAPRVAATDTPELLPADLPCPRPPLDAARTSQAAFPLGGIGTGNVSLGSRGEWRDWEIWGRPGKGNRLPYTFASVWCRATGEEPQARVLEARLRPPYEASHGLPPEHVAGLPRLAGASLRGEYPLARIDFQDETLPVALSLEAFTPMVPLDAAASGLPAAYLTYRARNTTSAPVDLTIVLSMANPVGWAGPEAGPDGRGGGCRNVRREPAGIAFHGERYGPDELRFGTAALTVDGRAGEVTAKTAWLRTGWWDALQDFWNDFSADGRLEDGKYAEASAEGHTDVASLGVALRLAPGTEAAVPFIVAWHFPNRPATWGRPGAETPRTRVSYAARFPDAWAVAEHALAQRAELTRRTVAFHRALWGGTLPPAVTDAVASNLVVLRSTTCFWLAGDLFLGWEGCHDQAGCCPGNCTHVWNYAQAGAFLYPELERSMRASEFGAALHDDGEMEFRVLPVFGEHWNHIPAVDGQLGTVLRVCREWHLSGDGAWLRGHYPAVKRALQYAAARWDPDGDGLTEAEQHNTYDINFYGPNPLGAGFLLAGLRAGQEMAAAMGDQAFADACHRLYQGGRARAEESLWNGAFYVQRIADVDEHRYQFGLGCLSDQLLGQLLAHVAGLGHVLDPDRVRSALRAIVRHNFRADLSAHASCQRTYALNDEAGLLLCTWPDGGRPRFPFPYADEVWTGIEYQVAAHLAYEGLAEEAVMLVAAVRARHTGGNRNPWNEFECGHHYARSLASYALLPALAGFDYDGGRAALRLAPRLPGALRSFFSVPGAWGTLECDDTRLRIEVVEGRLPLRTVSVRGVARALPDGTEVVSEQPLSVDLRG